MLLIGRPAAVVFDCDGLLVETESLWTLAMERMFLKNGIELTPEYREPIIGASTRLTSSLMAKVFPGDQDREALENEMLDTVQALIAADATVMPGVLEILQLIAERGVPYAVASNSPARIVETTLRESGLAEFFKIRITAEDVVHPKPAPDIYRTACARLGADPTQSIAFEDSVVGVKSAQAAGLKVIGIPTFNNTDFYADWVIPSMNNPELLNQVRSW